MSQCRLKQSLFTRTENSCGIVMIVSVKGDKYFVKWNANMLKRHSGQERVDKAKAAHNAF